MKGTSNRGQDCEEEEGEEGNRKSSMNLSVLFAGGLTPPQTMKLQGEVKGRRTMVLINSGASHNVISATLVQELGIPKECTPTY